MDVESILRLLDEKESLQSETTEKKEETVAEKPREKLFVINEYAPAWEGFPRDLARHLYTSVSEGGEGQVAELKVDEGVIEEAWGRRSAEALRGCKVYISKGRLSAIAGGNFMKNTPDMFYETVTVNEKSITIWGGQAVINSILEGVPLVTTVMEGLLRGSLEYAFLKGLGCHKTVVRDYRNAIGAMGSKEYVLVLSEKAVSWPEAVFKKMVYIFKQTDGEQKTERLGKGAAA